MKNIIFLVIFSAAALNSCSEKGTVSGASALTIVNAIPYSNPLLINFLNSNSSKTPTVFNLYNSEYQNTGGIGFGSFAEIGAYTGVSNLSLVQISDTFQYIFNGTFNLKVGCIYSLYIMGTDTLHTDTLFTKDNIPYYPYTGDSLTGVRFVNLVTGSNPISIDIQGNPNNTAVLSSLSYKAFSAFQPYSANANAQNNGYTFEFRDASGNVLATYPLNILPFKSQTLAFCGSLNYGLSVMAINNY